MGTYTAEKPLVTVPYANGAFLGGPQLQLLFTLLFCWV